MGTPIDLIVGLGNPGAEYEATRHNAGFWFVDLLASEHGGRFSPQRKLHGEAAEITIAGQRIRLLKPTTYMNLSGQAVGAAVNYYKIPTEHVLVAYDELDLPPGRAQLQVRRQQRRAQRHRQRHRAHRAEVLAAALRRRPSARPGADERRPQGSHQSRAQARRRRRRNDVARQTARSRRPSAGHARARRRASQESLAHTQAGDEVTHGYQVRHRRTAECR